MLLYHYTAKKFLGSIQREGLSIGGVPISPTEGKNAVWLTTDDDPTGHGLGEARQMTDEEVEIQRRLHGIPNPIEPPFWPDKRAVRIEVMIPSRDRKLKHWRKWAKKRLARNWYETLDKGGGGKSGKWYLYFGTIPASDFREILDLTKTPPSKL